MRKQDIVYDVVCWASWLAQLWLSFHFENGYSCCYILSDRDEFGASIDNSKEKLIDDDGMTKNNTESPASQPSTAVHRSATYL